MNFRAAPPSSKRTCRALGSGPARHSASSLCQLTQIGLTLKISAQSQNVKWPSMRGPDG